MKNKRSEVVVKPVRRIKRKPWVPKEPDYYVSLMTKKDLAQLKPRSTPLEDRAESESTLTKMVSAERITLKGAEFVGA